VKNPVNSPDDRPGDSRLPGLSTLWIVLVALVADQISKYIVTIKMTEYGPPIEVLGTFFRLTYIHNRGAAFGLNLGSPLIHTVVSIAALALLVYLFRTLPVGARLLRIALAWFWEGPWATSSTASAWKRALSTSSTSASVNSGAGRSSTSPTPL
jgi:hypothetical protein